MAGQSETTGELSLCVNACTRSFIRVEALLVSGLVKFRLVVITHHKGTVSVSV